MNIENISALMEQLHSFGFENIGNTLIKRISFKPKNFILSQKIERDKDNLTFQVFFEKERKQNFYVMLYYDAVLLKEEPLITPIINGVNTIELEKSMTEIDWKNAFDFSTIREINLEDKTNWEREMKVESIIENLSDLEKSEDGKNFAAGLKLKYWANTSYQEFFGNINPLKSRSQVSQRFYFSEDSKGISVDEAHRFLQNRWLEKQMQAKRKVSDYTEINGTDIDNHVSIGRTLQKKKHSGKFKMDNSSKAVQK